MVEKVVNIVNIDGKQGDITVMITLAGVHIQVSVRANMNLTKNNNIESERIAATVVEYRRSSKARQKSTVNHAKTSKYVSEYLRNQTS